MRLNANRGPAESHAGRRESRLHADAGAFEDGLANKEAFDMFDLDGDGEITAEEKKAILQAVEDPATSAPVPVHRAKKFAAMRSMHPSLTYAAQRAAGAQPIDVAQRRRENFERRWGAGNAHGLGVGIGSRLGRPAPSVPRAEQSVLSGLSGTSSSASMRSCASSHESAIPDFSWSRPALGLRSLKQAAPSLHEASLHKSTATRALDGRASVADSSSQQGCRRDQDLDRDFFAANRKRSNISRVASSLFGPSVKGHFDRSNREEHGLMSLAAAGATADEVSAMRREARPVPTQGMFGAKTQLCLRKSAPTGQMVCFLRDASS